MNLPRLRSVLLAVVLVGSALATAGCDSGLEPELLEDTDWRLTRLGDQSVSTSNPAAVPDLTFRSEDDRVSGTGGCNQFSGSYDLDGETITLGRIASTLMACEEGMEIESAFFAALERVRTWNVDGGTLELYDAGGEILMRFTI